METDVMTVEGQGVTSATAWYGILSGAVLALLAFLFSRQASTLSKSKPSTNATTVEEAAAEEDPAQQKEGSGEGDAMVTVCRTPPKGESMARAFLIFQRSYLCANVTSCFADWLKGAYIMSIYVQFGYTLAQISMLFTVAYVSSVVFGTVAGAVSDSFGRARSCRLYCLVYGLSLVLTTWNNVYAIYAARILGGLSTSLLTTAFESWVVAEHHAREFNPGWLQDTFSKSAVFGAGSAVLAGFVAEASVRAMGNVGPFLVPLPFLLASLFFMRHWPENYGDRTSDVRNTLVNGCREIARSGTLLLLLVCEALYDGALGVWIVMWTPALDSTNLQTPFGLVFAAYTLCMVSGGFLVRSLSLAKSLVLCHVLAVAAMVMTLMFYENKTFVFGCFMLYEVSTGVYYAAHPTLRSHIMADTTRASVMNIFRVPMNMLVVIILACAPSPYTAMMLLAGFQVASTLALSVLLRRKQF